jgi:thymidylate synthase
MSKIDLKYKELISKIYNEGFEYIDPNRSGVKRKQIPYYTFEWNFEDGFPAIGLKKAFPKSAFNEFKAFMLGENKLKQLEDRGVRFWRKDAHNFHKRRFPNSTITINRFMELVGTLDYNGNEFGDMGKIYPYQIRKWNGKYDQLQMVLNRLKQNPHTTKNIVTMWNPTDISDSALSPCHTRFSFVVTKLNNDSLGLYIQWNQDSVDVFLGLPMNIMYYSYACYVFAEYLGMKPLGVIGNLTNLHLYDNSFLAVEQLLKRDAKLNEDVNINVNVTEYNNDVSKFIEAIEYGKNIILSNYRDLGEIKVEMLPYS